MVYSEILKFQSMIYGVEESDMAKRIIIGLLNKSELFSRSVYFLASEEYTKEIEKLLENEIIKNCFADLKTDFKLVAFHSNEGKMMVVLLNSGHLGATILSKKEVMDVDISKDPYFNK